MTGKTFARTAIVTAALLALMFGGGTASAAPVTDTVTISFCETLPSFPPSQYCVTQTVTTRTNTTPSGAMQTRFQAVFDATTRKGPCDQNFHNEDQGFVNTPPPGSSDSRVSKFQTVQQYDVRCQDGFTADCVFSIYFLAVNGRLQFERTSNECA